MATPTSIGVAAYAAKGDVLMIFGYFLVQSAITHDPDRAAGGLDGASATGTA